MHQVAIICREADTIFFLSIMYFILFYFILYYFVIIFFFAYLFIYLFILPQIDPGKKSPPPSPTGVSPFTASFAGCVLPCYSRVFSIVSIMAALKILREVNACIYKGDEQPEKEMAIPGRAEDKTLTSERTGTV